MSKIDVGILPQRCRKGYVRLFYFERFSSESKMSLLSNSGQFSAQKTEKLVILKKISLRNMEEIASPPSLLRFSVPRP